MYKSVLVLFIAVIIPFGCGKKDSAQMKDIKPKDNAQTKQNQTQKNTAQNEMVDFSWTENGKKVKLSDHKGKVIFVNFWATWCPPCRKELPALSQISSELKGKDFVIVGVSVDDNQQVLDRFLNSNNLPYPVVLDIDGLVAKYMDASGQNQNVVPQSYIINKDGKIVEAIIGSRSKEDFLSLINKHL
ncbi:MAG: TlpA family protein disulfide reductase [Chlorobi bacterium]|nr:TlpA family protein disulfide reductase [Chlorobiota bacterium]